jgi:ABC-type transport system involved in multi-copper enzyme maturation permease subunit
LKNLLTVSAIIEFSVGLAFLSFPSFTVSLLLGSTPITPVVSVLARVLGLALLALGITCWLSRRYWQNHFTRVIAGGMLVFNTGSTLILAYAALGLAISGIGLWPAVLLHLAMAIWCIIKLKDQ